MEMRKESVEELKQRGQGINEKSNILIERKLQEDNLQGFIFIANEDNQELSIEENGQIIECKAMDFWETINIDVLDIDAENDSFIGCDYINENIIILEYDNRIIKISK